MNSPAQSLSAREASSESRVLVLSNDPSRQTEIANLARGLGCTVTTAVLGIPETTSWVEIDAILLVVLEGREDWRALIARICREEAAPPIVVLGPGDGGTWRDDTAEAFVCGSFDAPVDDLRSLLSAAIRYRSLEREINLLRVECERICLGLLKSYGQAAANLKSRDDEVQALQESLREIRNRIIRAFV